MPMATFDFNSMSVSITTPSTGNVAVTCQRKPQTY
jgi:hypothetical protein